MNPENILKAIGIVTELASGIVQITQALDKGMTKEDLEAFIEAQNAAQKRLREEILAHIES